MTNLDSIFKSRDITWPTKVHIVKAMVFAVVMYGCESCTIKKAEHWRIDVFKLWCWRRHLRVRWTCKEIKPVNSKGNQPWILIGRTDAEAETPILCPPDGKNWLRWKRLGKDPGCWERLKAGGERDDRGCDGCMVSPTQWIWVWVSSGSLCDGQGSLVCCSPWGHKELETTEWLNGIKLLKTKF